MNYRKFNTLSDAFNHYRKANYPVRVWINGRLYKLYPSGRAELLYVPPID